MNLMNLDTYMKTVNGNIEKFNQYVKLQRSALQARGEKMEVYVLLWKGYKACTDDGFVDYMRRKHESYEEGNRISDDAYMQLAEDKYKSLIETNEWNVPSKKDEGIVALQATVAKRQKDVAGNRNKKAKKSPEDKNEDKKEKKGQKSKEREARKKVPPKEDDKMTIKKGEKTYHWCQHHKLWTIHKQSDCKGVAPNHKAWTIHKSSFLSVSSFLGVTPLQSDGL
jgi:hypothetical protein